MHAPTPTKADVAPSSSSSSFRCFQLASSFLLIQTSATAVASPVRFPQCASFPLGTFKEKRSKHLPISPQIPLSLSLDNHTDFGKSLAIIIPSSILLLMPLYHLFILPHRLQHTARSLSHSSWRLLNAFSLSPSPASPNSPRPPLPPGRRIPLFSSPANRLPRTSPPTSWTPFQNVQYVILPHAHATLLLKTHGAALPDTHIQRTAKCTLN